MADDNKIYVYTSSVSGSSKIKKEQERVINVLTVKKVPFDTVDIATDSDAKVLMREICQNKTAMAPQICRGRDYLGDYQAFDEAVETGTLQEFLKL